MTNDELGPWGRRGWIVTAPRSGSTYLCYLLNAAVGERFDMPEDRAQARYTFGEHVALCRGTEKFLEWDPIVTKMHRHYLRGDLPGWDRAEVERRFPGVRFVWLERSLVRQAASLYFSDVTKVCQLETPEEQAAYRSRPVAIDDGVLRQKYRQVAAWHRAWEHWLRRGAYLRITYEGLAADPAGTVAAVLDYLAAEQTHDLPAELPLYRTQRPETEEAVRRLTRMVEGGIV